MLYLNKALSTVAVTAVFAQLLPFCCRAGDAVFSNDGQRIYVTSTTAAPENRAALDEIDLTNQASRTIPLLQIPKEGANYEAVIEKKGKQWGVEINADGKVLSKHDESKEKGKKH